MYIEQWITSSDVITLPVHHARLKINDTCIVLLASFDDPECPGYLTPPSQSVHTTASINNDMTTSDSVSEFMTTTIQMTMGSKSSETVSSVDTKQPQFDVGAIVGGAFAIVLVICITTGVVVISFLLYLIFKLKHTQTTKQRYWHLQLFKYVLYI